MSSLNSKKRLAILAAVACFMLMSRARPRQVPRAPVNPWRIAAKLDTCLEGVGLEEEVQGSTGWRGLRG
mgnify:CR=1 FL=1